MTPGSLPWLHRLGRMPRIASSLLVPNDVSHLLDAGSDSGRDTRFRCTFNNC